jgi:hypothetical protein
METVFPAWLLRRATARPVGVSLAMRPVIVVVTEVFDH